MSRLNAAYTDWPLLNPHSPFRNATERLAYCSRQHARLSHAFACAFGKPDKMQLALLARLEEEIDEAIHRMFMEA